LAGRSELTFKNYLRAIAQTCLFYNRLPLELSDDQINHYLTLHKTGQLDRLNPSEAYFKHTVFGFRYMFKTYGIKNRKISMPVMKRKKPLRDIMNRYEVMQLLKAATLDKHKIAFALAYGSGLRIKELTCVKLRDFDLIRKTVHVRDGKGGYDRFVPISDDFIRGYTKYLHSNQIIDFLLPGQIKGRSMSISAIQHALVNARRKAGILKKISMHNMRHTYAVHFLEDTGDLLKLKQYLGHRDIKNTMTYLKYVQAMPTTDAYSPLTKVFNLARQNKNS
jgi:site-specific recombinase XerD